MSVTLKNTMALQIVQTKFLSWTNHKPARISARATNGKFIIRTKPSLTVSPPAGCDENVWSHFLVAKELAESMGWEGEMVAGSVQGGYVFSFTK